MLSIYSIEVYIKNNHQIFFFSNYILVDRSGQISKRELKNVLKALQIKVDDKELQVLLNQMDVNRSGEIDFNEFKAVMAEKYFVDII